MSMSQSLMIRTYFKKGCYTFPLSTTNITFKKWARHRRKNQYSDQTFLHNIDCEQKVINFPCNVLNIYLEDINSCSAVEYDL